jgi:hypothetical protein
MTESCSLNTAELSASCVATIAADMFGQANAKTIRYNLTGTDYYQYAVQVTKGASRTADGGSCEARVSRASALRARSGSGIVLGIGAMIVVAVISILVL